MVRMTGVTGETPARHMSVARGRLVGAMRDIPFDVVAAARTAAVYAVKDGTRFVPSAPPFSLTEAFCDLDWEDGAGGSWVATVTVVGYARSSLETTALAGVGAALLALWDHVKGQDAAMSEALRATDFHVVQNTVG